MPGGGERDKRGGSQIKAVNAQRLATPRHGNGVFPPYFGVFTPYFFRKRNKDISEGIRISLET
jgi:hypothetical protein